jgi:hypothetical protein
MAKITETKPTPRAFILEVNEEELRFIQRGLLEDNTNDDENHGLYGFVSNFMDVNGVAKAFEFEGRQAAGRSPRLHSQRKSAR